MGCNTAKQVALQELSDIFEILKIENSTLEEEKEGLLKDQIDKPAEDKEIQQSIKKMTLELEDTYRKAFELLNQLIASAEFQRDGSPSSRIYQIHKLRFNLEEIYGKIESFHLQKKQLNHENDELRILIQNERTKNLETQVELKSFQEKQEEVYPENSMAKIIINNRMRSKFTCPLPSCRRSYVNSSILKRHIQAFHNAEKRFQCVTCGKCLASQQNLKEHTYIHTGEKPYLCPFQGCGAKFRQGTHLSSHKRMFHENLSDFPNIHLELNFDLIIKKLCFEMSRETRENLEVATNPQEKLDLPLITGPTICNIPSIF